jgi:acetyltransferase-like isoleucine patch superfamily enzyme
MKALHEVGVRAIIVFLLSTLWEIVFSVALFPPMRVLLLRLSGATIGKNVVVHRVKFLNLYRGGIKNLVIGDNCFLGSDVLLDLADRITLEDSVTVADRAIILTHLNVGYADHPLQKTFPPYQKETVIKYGTFVGVNSTVLGGTTIGSCSFIAAGSVVTKPVDAYSLVGGVPARFIKSLKHS